MKKILKKYLNRLKKINPFGLLIIGFIIGMIIMFLSIQPKLAYQGKTARDWANVVNKNQTLASQNHKTDLYYENLLNKQLASASAQIKTLLNTPPKVVYKTQTQYVEQPAQPQDTSSHCNPDLLGGQNCYSNSGTYTHCTSNLIGGMNCN